MKSESGATTEFATRRLAAARASTANSIIVRTQSVEVSEEQASNRSKRKRIICDESETERGTVLSKAEFRRNRAHRTLSREDSKRSSRHFLRSEQ